MGDDRRGGKVLRFTVSAALLLGPSAIAAGCEEEPEVNMPVETINEPPDPEPPPVGTGTGHGGAEPAGTEPAGTEPLGPGTDTVPGPTPNLTAEEMAGGQIALPPVTPPPVQAPSGGGGPQLPDPSIPPLG